MAIKPICTKCIHNMGDGCEAFRDDIDEEDDYTREWG